MIPRLTQRFKNLIGKISVALLFLPMLAGLVAPVLVQAQGSDITAFQILPYERIACDVNAPPNCGLLNALYKFLLDLAPILAVLVIAWGGYQYFFGALTDNKADGMRTIQAGVFGLTIALGAKFIGDIVQNTVTGEGLKPDYLIKFIQDNLINFLVGLAGVVAVLVIVWGGYQYFFSTLPNGKKDGLENIQKGVIGLIVVLIANPLKDLVVSTLNVQKDGVVKLDPKSIIFVIQNIVSNFLIPISAVVTVFFFVWGSYLWLTAGGNAGQVKKGQENMRNALIGFIFVLLATTISQLIIYFFGGLKIE
jgi:type IV secretory pathway VirB2 component (pilin)